MSCGFVKQCINALSADILNLTSAPISRQQGNALFMSSSNVVLTEHALSDIDITYKKASDSIDPSWDDLVPSLSPLNIKMLCVVRKQSHSVLFVEHRMSKTVVPGHQQVVNMLRFNRLLGLRTVEINHCFNFTGIRDE